MILLRSLLFNIVMFGSCILLSAYGQAVKRFAPGQVILIGQLWARMTIAAVRVICGLRIEISGTENLPAGGALIAAQHQSALDIMVWLRLLPRPAFVLKQELLKFPLFGSLMPPAGMIAVDRAGGAASLRKMLEECRDAIADGKQIVIFPEGTRVAPGVPGKLQPGIVALAKALNVPVVPAATDSGLRWGRKAFTKRPGVVKVRIFPVLPAGLRREDVITRLSECYYDVGV
jgi:1-acyl-sn-glycerol-3-phosphate acyltransferase